MPDGIGRRRQGVAPGRGLRRRRVVCTRHGRWFSLFPGAPLGRRMGAVVSVPPSRRRLFAGCLSGSWLVVFALSRVATPVGPVGARVAPAPCCCAHGAGHSEACPCCARHAGDRPGGPRASLCCCDLGRGGEQHAASGPDRACALAPAIASPRPGPETPVSIGLGTTVASRASSPPEPVPRMSAARHLVAAGAPA